MGCTQAEMALLLEAIGERIERECGEKIRFECYQVIKRVINDVREHGKEYIRSRYGI